MQPSQGFRGAVLMGLLALAGTACEPGEAEPPAAANAIETPALGTPRPSLGPVTVEEVAGLREARAVAVLEKLGLRVRVTERYTMKTPARILWVKPEPGTEVDPRTRVTIAVALAYPEVPNVIGMGVEQATKLLERAGYKVERAIGRVVESGESLSTVIATDPSAGSPRLPGRTVTIFTPGEPPPPPAPVAPPPPDYDFDICDFIDPDYVPDRCD